MNGIDVSSYQPNINIAGLAGDFAIVKATEGISYVNPYFSAQAQSTLNGKKLLGIYHYASGYNYKAEADHFISVAKDYIGKAIFMLDFEDSVVSTGGVPWAQAFLDYVKSEIGATPFIYIGLADENRLNWSNVAKSYPLWVAQYNNYNTAYGYQPRAIYGKVKHWDRIAIFQYSASTILQGWNARLDVNMAYMTAQEWQSFASGNTEIKKEDEEMSWHPLVKYDELGQFKVNNADGATIYSTYELNTPTKDKVPAGNTYKIFRAKGGALLAGTNQWLSSADGLTKINPLAVNPSAKAVAIITSDDAWTQNMPKPNQAGIKKLDKGTAWQVSGRQGKYLVVGSEKDGIYIDADKTKIVL